MENIKIGLEALKKIADYCTGHSACKFCMYSYGEKCLIYDSEHAMPFEWDINKKYCLTKKQYEIIREQCLTMDCHVCPYYCDTITTRKCVMVAPDRGVPWTW